MNWYKQSQSRVFYHGSDSEEIIGPLVTGERDSGWFGSGFYLSAYPVYANRWGKNIYYVAVPDGLKFAEASVIGNYEEIIFAGDAQKADEMAGGSNAWIENEQVYSDKIKSALQEMGYGGIKVHFGNNKDVEVVVFDPSQLEVKGRVEEGELV